VLKEYLNKLTEDEQKSFLEDKLNTSNKKFIEYIAAINKAQETIDKIYQKTKKAQEMSFRDSIANIAWGKNSPYSESDKKTSGDLGDEWEKITYRLRVARTYLFDALMHMEKKLKIHDDIELKKLIVFKPRSDFNGEESLPGEIPSTDLKGEKSKEKIEGDGLPIDREFQNTNIIINAKQMMMEEEFIKIGEELTYIPLEYEEMAKYLSNSKDLSGGSSYVYFLKDFEKEFVGYYFELPDKSDKYGAPGIDEYKSLLKNIFDHVSAIFLAAWNSIHSEYNNFYYKSANKYIDHEMGQVLAGIRSASDVYLENKFKAEYISTDNIIVSFPNLPKEILTYLKEVDRYCKYMTDFSDRITSITSSGFIGDLERDVKKSSFRSYENFVERLMDINQLQAEYNHIIIEPIDKENMYNDFICTYKHKLEQALNNLIRNAVKYSHAYTYIRIDIKKAKENDLDGYEFIITNYGVPISAKDEKSIFKLGKRGENSAEYSDDDEGIGFGLYIAKRFAEQLGGNLILLENKKISEYNIPLLDYYTKLDITTVINRKKLINIKGFKKNVQRCWKI